MRLHRMFRRFQAMYLRRILSLILFRSTTCTCSSSACSNHRDPAAEDRHAVALHQGSVPLASDVVLRPLPIR